MIINDSEIKIKSIEKEIYEMVCQAGCKLFASVLERLDDLLMVRRDRTEYRHKGKRKTVLKTMMGEVEYERTVYEYKTEDGKKKCVFLLDAMLGCEKNGQMSELLCEKIAQAACEGSFRYAADCVSEMTGQSISHSGVWNVIQELGVRVDKLERNEAQLAIHNHAQGKEEAKLLFEEQDGIYLNLQGKDREKIGKSAEMKIAMAYTGAKETGRDRWNLAGKVACAKFEKSKEFFQRKEGVIASTYNIDEIEMRILNGDGASWIKRSITDETVHYQLDPFHRNKAVMQYVGSPEARANIFHLLYTKQIDLCLDVIEAYSNSTDDEKEQENYMALLTYFKNNKDGLTSYKQRNLDLPMPRDGIEYRSLGTMESNVYSIIGRRMKHRRANWSIRGGNNLAGLLTLKATGKLSETLSSIVFTSLPEKYAEEVTTVLSAAKTPCCVGKGYNGFAKATIPSNLQWLKDLCGLKPLSQLRF